MSRSARTAPRLATLMAAGLASCLPSLASAEGEASCNQSAITSAVLAACDAAIADPARSSDRAYHMAFRGHAAMVLGKTDAALADFDAALAEGLFEWRFANGEAPDPAYWAAMIEIGQGKPQAALARLDSRLQRNPADPRALAARAQALAAIGNADWALAAASAARSAAQAAASQSTYPLSADPWNRGPAVAQLDDEVTRLGEQAAREEASLKASQSPASLLLATALAEGKAGKAATELQAIVERDPANQQAQFALGIARFVVAVEHLGQSLHRHGLAKTDMPLLDSMMFLRMPVPDNAAPEPLTYETARAILDRFAADLALSREALSRVDDPALGLDLDLKAIRLDLDGNGRSDPGEELAALYEAVSGARLDEATKAGFRLRLDAADATWLQGYTHLLSGMANLVNGYDWSSTYNTVFFRFFPKAGVPNAELANRAGPGTSGFDEAEIVDLIAFIHTLNWPVADAARLAAARQDLLATVRLSRENWKRIRAETDNDHEWVPGPGQTGAIAGMAVTEQVVTGWLGFLDAFEAVLEGNMLLPHWRYDEGINVKRLFDKPTTLDVVMWIQGPALKPYLDAGRVGTGADFNGIMTMMNGDIFRYALWFN